MPAAFSSNRSPATSSALLPRRFRSSTTRPEPLPFQIHQQLAATGVHFHRAAVVGRHLLFQQRHAGAFLLFDQRLIGTLVFRPQFIGSDHDVNGCDLVFRFLLFHNDHSRLQRWIPFQ